MTSGPRPPVPADLESRLARLVDQARALLALGAEMSEITAAILQVEVACGPGATQPGARIRPEPDSDFWPSGHARLRADEIQADLLDTAEALHACLRAVPAWDHPLASMTVVMKGWDGDHATLSMSVDGASLFRDAVLPSEAAHQICATWPRLLALPAEGPASRYAIDSLSVVAASSPEAALAKCALFDAGLRNRFAAMALPRVTPLVPQEPIRDAYAALMAELPPPGAALPPLEERRRAAADDLYETVDLGTVAGAGGWETGGGLWRRTVFIATGTGASTAHRLEVAFAPNSHRIRHAIFEGRDLPLPA